MKIKHSKTIIIPMVATLLLSGCANMQTGNETFDNNQKAIIGAGIGAIAGTVIGHNVSDKHKGRNKVIGAVAGAAIGGAIGYSLDKQAREMAQTLDTSVNNNPNAQLDPSQDLIVSNTDKYVKIMFRDDKMFEVGSATPTYSANQKISKINATLRNYPDTIVQVVGHTDNSGSAELNQRLSQQRAANVGNIIYNSGVSNQMFSKGCSYNKPIVANTTKENMALNRRVEIYLYPNETSIIDVCR